ncbi:hypothetical protein [Flavihumibacter fluvii]|uniref:hypothetical protein n=1 Tax=Flavihumibacter fluvii TaxID=2838157 RepID=UPI001BDE5AD5|nr:hypothetical protein [Flavihumibacter fluvii]ULQ53054.1 hypothetical protein KJS93_01825 [Flavihumibacter fluvii]
MNAIAKKWCRIAFFNLLLVAVAGVLLRIKTIFPVPWLNYKYLLHGHSHFAFAGWVSLFLMAALVGDLPVPSAQKYHRLFLYFAISAYGMLLSFPFQGYALLSISFSTISVFLSWWFAFLFWQDCSVWGKKSLGKMIVRWALAFLVLSSMGTFYLAWLMVTRVNNPDLYFGAVYFYLHFQYNGWFFFTILALFLRQLPVTVQEKMRSSLQVLSVATIPAWFLSALWMRLPTWMYVTACIAAIVQFFAYLRVVGLFVKVKGINKSAPAVRTLWILSLIALSIKFLLQTGSIFPSLSQYAFAYRPVVIGYLHLVLLGFVSLFNMGWMMEHEMFTLPGGRLPASVGLFLTGFILTELNLMAQGITAMFFVHIPYTNEFLLFAAICLLVSLVWMNLNVWKKHCQPA